ncbi:MAG: phosphoribosylglycinamide formyltransferase [Candidatus Omnitrophica bacterium]|nr:phosphoribosylglycinamide formyltransferase [Candidatus Omnitrophota bacterium]
MKIAIFASGRGTNFSAILNAVKKGRIKGKVALLVCDNPKAAVIKKATRAKIKIALVEKKDYLSKDDFEKQVIRHLKENKIDLVVLAGFMRILGARLVRGYKNKIINIHPALLPSFKGACGIKDAFDYGAKVTGVTVHFVDEKTDHGPIILQEPVEIKQGDTLESLEARIHKSEHRLYPEAIRLYARGKLKIEGRKVRILKGAG